MGGKKWVDPDYQPGDMVEKTYFSDNTKNLYIVIERINTQQYMCYDLDDGHIGPIILNTEGTKYIKVKKLA